VEKVEESPEKKITDKFGILPPDLISAAVEIYREIVKWHETSIRLSTAQFCVAQQRLELLMKMVIFLLASDLARDIRVPLLTKFWLAGELGGKRGWVRLKLRLLKKRTFPKD
jgi:hypothetical protein